jgi:hypothetical protein
MNPQLPSWRRSCHGAFVLLAGLLIFRLSHLTSEAQTPVLQFIAPTNGALFSTTDEIPIMLRAVASNDVFLTADVFANHVKLATVSYCCSLCPCWHPLPGEETTLQIPVPRNAGHPASRAWQGWTNVLAGTYELTAVATGDLGTRLEAKPVTITVLDLSLRIWVSPDGSVNLVIPEGSLVPGGFELEASQDLRTWTRLGPFQPGNVAAFYFEPPEQFQERRFYRSAYTPPRGP